MLKIRLLFQSSRHNNLISAAALIVASAGLYILSFIDNGLIPSISAFVAIVPLFIFAERYGPALSALAGAIVGAIVMGFLCRWLVSFHFAAVLVGIAIGSLWFALAMTAIAFLLSTKTRVALLAAGFVWCCSELGRSIGFLAFPYATLPYAFAYSRAALYIASIGGVALVSLIISLSNVSLFAALRRLYDTRQSKPLGVVATASFGIACIVITLALGPAPKPDKLIAWPMADTPQSGPSEAYFRVALVQACAMSQKNIHDYARAFASLASLSDSVLAHKPDLVVWHETAVVPPIEWHLRHRPDRATYNFIQEVDTYLKAYPVPLLTGNGYAQADDVIRRVEHNSALLYSKGSIVDRYDKVMLVPFSEYMPQWARMPFLDSWLIERFGPYWTPGDGPKLLLAGNARLAAPICFEDSFGHYFSSFSNNNANESPDFFVVLTNDAWAQSEYMQRQHLAMSQFRAAETGSIVLRSADTGSTAAIASNGALVQVLPAFQAGVLIVDVPLGEARQTIYEKSGRIMDIAILGIALFLSLCAFIKGMEVIRIDKNDGI